MKKVKPKFSIVELLFVMAVMSALAAIAIQILDPVKEDQLNDFVNKTALSKSTATNSVGKFVSAK